MTLSIIICSFKRSQQLVELLKDILEKEARNPEIEFILVLQHYSDREIRLIESLMTDSFQMITDHNLGLSRARNIGMAHAKGKFLSFWDDDIRLPQAITPVILNAFVAKKWQCFTGIELPIFSKNVPSWYQDKLILQNYEQSEKRNNVFLHGSMMCITRHLLTQAGHFQGFFGHKGKQLDYGEDTYLEYKVKKLGLHIQLEKNLTYKHDKTKLLDLSTLLKSSFKKGKASTHLKIMFEGLSIRYVAYLLKSFFVDCIKLVVSGLPLLMSLGMHKTPKKTTVVVLNRMANHAGSLSSVLRFNVLKQDPYNVILPER